MAGLKITMDATGAADLQQALQQLAPALRDQALKPGLAAAGKVLVAGMASRAPRAAVHRVKRRGSSYPYRLADSIGMTVRVTPKEASLQVGPLERAFWGRWQEKGTKFMPAQPYMRPTLQADAPAALNAFVAAVRAQFEAVVQQSAPGAPAGRT